jgi:hypothetical protein
LKAKARKRIEQRNYRSQANQAISKGSSVAHNDVKQITNHIENRYTSDITQFLDASILRESTSKITETPCNENTDRHSKEANLAPSTVNDLCGEGKPRIRKTHNGDSSDTYELSTTDDEVESITDTIQSVETGTEDNENDHKDVKKLAKNKQRSMIQRDAEDCISDSDGGAIVRPPAITTISNGFPAHNLNQYTSKAALSANPTLDSLSTPMSGDSLKSLQVPVK